MIEIVFSESACGSLKHAFHYGRGAYSYEATPGLVYYSDSGEKALTEADRERLIREYHEQERKRWEAAVPMEGSSGDVFSLSFNLSAGDISEETFGEKRIAAQLPFYLDAPQWIDGRSGIIKNMAQTAEDLEQVLQRLREGEPVRIWYSDNPDEACGMLWFLWKIHRLGVSCKEITAVKLPEWVCDGASDTLIQMQSWGEVGDGLWGKLKENGRVLPRRFCEAGAMRWEELRRENAPLRAVINGRVVSAGEDLYDRYLLDAFEYPEEEVGEGMLIGRVLRQQLGIWDGWLHLRIEKFIGDGRIEVVRESGDDRIYGRVIRKIL